MTSADGLWGNSLTKDVTAFLPLSELQGMPDGLVRVWVHAKDVAGNWGPFHATDLVLDRTAPVVNSATNTAAPLPSTTTTAAATLTLAAGSLSVASASRFSGTGGKLAVTTSTGVQVLTYAGVSGNTLTSVTGGTVATIAVGATVTPFTGIVSLTAQDNLTNGVSSGVAGAEWFTGADPGPGNGTRAVTLPASLTPTPNSATPVTFTVTGLPAGATVSIRVVDAAGNWSAIRTVQM